MRRIIRFKNGLKEVWNIMPVEDLCTNIKLNLKVQVMEFINEIEDCEDETASIASIYAVKFLDSCYLAA
jgi:hypothetical protein